MAPFHVSRPSSAPLKGAVLFSTVYFRTQRLKKVFFVDNVEKPTPTLALFSHGSPSSRVWMQALMAKGISAEGANRHPLPCTSTDFEAAQLVIEA